MADFTATQPRTVTSDSLALSDTDLYLFNEGTHSRLYLKLGAHLCCHGKDEGARFAVWAPDAQRVSVIGDFNGWDTAANVLYPQGSSGIWAGFVPNAHPGQCYKYHIESRYNGYSVDKADPFAFAAEVAPRTGSVLWELDYEWHDQEWMANRPRVDSHRGPMSIYEVHLGAWRRKGDGSEYLSYRELAEQLPEYVRDMGFTHVEFLPVMEHPFFGSWGYQTTGYFAPSSRYGTPQDFMYLVDTLHQAGIGVILDWVPSHFPTDEHSLGYFDGTHLYEHADVRQGFHPDWDTYIFNYSRHEVRSFLMSSAAFWMDFYHADGLRVDAVASMLYLDYSRKEGEWIPNKYGGRENLDAIEFMRQMNQELYASFPGIQTIAEESTAWPGVSRPAYMGGLGFGFKWDMGWMHDTLRYFSRDPIHRRYHYHELTFRMIYAFHENFVLPLSHDEVVHGKGSLIGKQPGDEWQKFANMRLLFGYMFAQPGKKLMFMGGEFGQTREWVHDVSLDWHLLEYAPHSGLQAWVRDLNRAYREVPALHRLDCDPTGFEWIDCSDADNSIYSWLRVDREGDAVLVVVNATPVLRENFRVGVPAGGWWAEILNSDSADYFGSNQGNAGGRDAEGQPFHGRPYSLNITLPPLGIVFFRGRM